MVATQAKIINENYLPHSAVEMVYNHVVISSGIWFKGALDTEDTSSSSIMSMSVSKKGYSPDILTGYSIGDKGRYVDMTIDSKKATAATVGSILVNDAAFVRRTDGSWTYATVEDRSYDASPNKIQSQCSWIDKGVSNVAVGDAHLSNSNAGRSSTCQ
jgi:hypothetical protein